MGPSMAKSKDGGRSWKFVGSPAEDAVQLPTDRLLYLIQDPHQPDRLWAADLCVPLLESMDGGEIWKMVEPDGGARYIRRISVCALPEAEAPPMLVIFGSGGVSVSRDGGGNWKWVNANLPVGQLVNGQAVRGGGKWHFYVMMNFGGECSGGVCQSQISNLCRPCNGS
jgi:hypothetical protein